MKVLVACVACGSGSEEEVRSAFKGLIDRCERFLSSGAQPFLFELPDNTTHYEIKVDAVGWLTARYDLLGTKLCSDHPATGGYDMNRCAICNPRGEE